MQMPELIEDSRFISNELRVQYHRELKTIIEKWLSNKMKNDAVDIILKGGCPAAPIYNIAEVAADEHISHVREMFVEVNHPIAGKTKIAGNQIKFSKDKITIDKPAPMLGQHNHEVYSEVLGLSLEEIQDYEENGII